MDNKPTDIGDIVEIWRENILTGYYFIKEIKPDNKPRWWHVTFELVNSIQLFNNQLVSDLLIDTDQLNGEPFTVSGIPMEIKKYSSAIAGGKEKKKEISKDIISLF